MTPGKLKTLSRDLSRLLDFILERLTFANRVSAFHIQIAFRNALITIPAMVIQPHKFFLFQIDSSSLVKENHNNVYLEKRVLSTCKLHI